MLLDTSFVIDVMRADKPALALLDEIEAGSEAIRIPTPVYYELWEGIERSRYPVREARAVEDVLRSYPTVDLRSEHAIRAGRISGALVRRGESLDDVDVLIAGMAVEESETLVTRNVKDFGRVPDLPLRSY